MPVICVSNLVLGGAGKTPFSIKLRQLLSKNFSKMYILTRGYKGKTKRPLIVNQNMLLWVQQILGRHARTHICICLARLPHFRCESCLQLPRRRMLLVFMRSIEKLNGVINLNLNAFFTFIFAKFFGFLLGRRLRRDMLLADTGRPRLMRRLSDLIWQVDTIDGLAPFMLLVGRQLACGNTH